MSAIPLVTITPEGEFEVHSEAISLLESCTTPIAVVAIAGLYRTGKSFLMNVLTENPGGFQVGSTVNACTKGIWLWSVPKYDADKNISIFFMDTEGLGSTNRSSTHDSRIFALALLLSSFFVYNSRGVIDGQAIEDLSLVTNLTKVIHVKSSSGGSAESDGDSLSQFFPSFLWVVRDFTLKLVDDKGNKISSAQYLENCLKPQSGFTESITSKNQIRQLINSFFRERDCLTMVRPAEDEEVLRNLSIHHLTELRPEFQRQVGVFVNKIFGGLRAKQMMGKILNGEMLCTLLKSYVYSLNTGGVPVISSAWERVVTSQCQEAKDNALSAYSIEIENLLNTGKKHASYVDCLPIAISTLTACHDAAKVASKALFWSKLSDKNDATARDYGSQLKEELRSKKIKLLEENSKKSESISESYISTQLQMLSLSSRLNASLLLNDDQSNINTTAINSHLKDFQQLFYSIQKIALEAQGDPYLGPSGPKAFNKLFGSQIFDELLSWASAVSEAFRIIGDKMQTDSDVVSQDLAEAKSRMITLKNMLEQQAKTSQFTAAGLRERIDSEKEKHETEVHRKEAEISRYEFMIDDLMKMHQDSLELMRNRQVSLRERLEEEKKGIIDEERKLHGDTFALINEEGSATSNRAQEAGKIEKDIATQEARIAELEEQLTKLDAEQERNNETLTVKNNLALNKEKAASKRAIEAERVLMDSDDKREEETRKQAIKDLQEKIALKSTMLQGVKDATKPGSQVKVSNPAFSAQNHTSTGDEEDGDASTSQSHGHSNNANNYSNNNNDATDSTTDGKKKKRFFGGFKKFLRS